MTTEQNDHALESALQQVAKSEQSSRRATVVATVIPVALGLAFLAFTYFQVSDLQAQKDKLNGRVGELQTQDHALQAQIEEKQRELQKLEDDVAVLKPLAGEALGRKPERIEGASSEILAGARARAATDLRLAGSADEKARRRNLTVMQYSKSLASEVNLDVVVLSLKSYGFQVANKPSKLQTVDTNALWFGQGVEEDDVRLVAVTLMNAGVEIRWISRFRNKDTFETTKRTRIDIGGWAKAKDRPWTTQEVLDTRELAGVGNPARPGFRP